MRRLFFSELRPDIEKILAFLAISMYLEGYKLMFTTKK